MKMYGPIYRVKRRDAEMDIKLQNCERGMDGVRRGFKERYALLHAFLLSLCFQYATLFSVGGADFKLYHLVAIAVIVASLYRRGERWAIPSEGVLLLVLFLFAIALINTLIFGMNQLLLNYCVFLAIIYSVYNLGIDISLAEWGALVRRIAFVILLLALAKLIVYRAEYIRFLTTYSFGHPLIPSFFGGGLNLEASYIALFGVCFKPNRQGFLYTGGSLLLSGLYASRTGLILSFMVFVYVFVFRNNRLKSAGRAAFFLLVVLVLLVSIAFSDLPVVGRFLTAGEDYASTARTDMWSYVPEAFQKAPIFGFGPGNSISAISSLAGHAFSVDNLHNIYAQVLLDFGLFGFIPFIIIIASLLIKELKNGFKNPFGAYILTFFIGALAQFKGAEPILAFAIAAYLVTTRNITIGGQTD